MGACHVLLNFYMFVMIIIINNNNDNDGPIIMRSILVIECWKIFIEQNTIFHFW